MKITTMLSYSGGFRRAAADVGELEKAGLDLVWVAEAYGLDSPSLMGYLAALTERVEIGSAILPIYTRTPTLIAMTAEVADGWIPMLFMPERARNVWGASLDAGRARRDPSLGPP
ncbi:MAG TPA: LLM class flavin-dependent oxidoreductase, partial [Acidimicrobiales bacterium]|nr:LLM class flavin-dependent oxidoreductase [Acidimicrobiales bacterium]